MVNFTKSAVRGISLLGVLGTIVLLSHGVTSSARAQGNSSPEVRVWVQGTQGELEKAKFFIDGKEVTGTTQLEEPTWEVTVWIDSELSGGGAVRRLSDLLLSQLDLLGTVGSLQIVRADPDPSTVLAASTDREAIERSLYELYFRPETSDRIRHQRSQWLREPIANGASTRSTSEIRLLQTQRDELFSWLADQGPSPNPRLLLLLDEGIGLDPSAFYRSLEINENPPRTDQLIQVATSLGWMVAPVAVDEEQQGGLSYRATEETPVGFRVGLGGRKTPSELQPDPLADDDQIRVSGTLPVLQRIASATSAHVVTDTKSLRELLASLEHRHPVTLPWPADRRGQVLSLRVQRRNGKQLPATEWISPDPSHALAEMRIRRLLDQDEEGELPLQILVAPSDNGASQLVVQGAWSEVDYPFPSQVRISTALQLETEELVYRHDVVTPDAIDLGDLEHRSELQLPDSTATALVVVEDLATGSWGGAYAQFISSSLPQQGDLDLNALTREPTRKLRILPLATEGAIEGRVLVTAEASSEVNRVHFFLDGEPKEELRRRPFATKVRLGRGGARHIVEAVAFDASGEEIGRDFLVLNEAAETFWVRILSPDSGDHVGPVEVQAEVQVPSGETLERIDYYWRNELIATSRDEPHRKKILIPYSNPSGFIRVEAELQSGRTTEDVVLMNSARFGSQVQVEVVELFVVVTDNEGQPVRDLAPSAFEVLDAGVEQSVESVRLAQDLPLTVGLAIDSSGSLFAKLPRVQEAAANFVSGLSSGRDEAFLVGFGNRPRVVQASTRNLSRVAQSIGDLSAGGKTAVWEAVVLSLLQLEEVNGRKALVVFYDGDDEDENFSYRTALSIAKETGVPIYLIVMNNTAARTDGKGFRTRSFTGKLDRMAKAGGGRVYYVPTDANLQVIYESISEELRSHYLITYTPNATSNESVWRSVEVNVEGRGLEARTLSGYDSVRP